MISTVPKLYLVPTPIGNLEDITFRAVRILKSVDTILCEDTRTSSVLLKHYEIAKPLFSYHAFNEHKVLDGIVQKLKEGNDIALITDAGTPGISDPGFLLVRECIRNGIAIECLPGATAMIPALVKSGLPSDAFVFYGFLPVKKGRQTLMKKLSEEEHTMIFYESPYRLLKTIDAFILFLGKDREASVSRELTKIYEETVNGSLEKLYQYFNVKTVKGEIVIVVAGKDSKGKRDEFIEVEEETEEI